LNDQCVAGECTGTSICDCQVDSDCKDDGNFCNGLAVCDKTEAAYKCKANAKAVVPCTQVGVPGCLLSQCEPKTGACVLTNKPNGTSCEDGIDCTVADTCQAGKCQLEPGSITCECLASADCAKSEDGNLCNGTLFCDLKTHTCKLNPQTVVKCPTDDTQCLRNFCDGATGKCGKYTPDKLKKKAGCGDEEDLAVLPLSPCPLELKNPTELAFDPTASAYLCNDGNSCTQNDECIAGACKPGPTNICDCKQDVDCLSQEDGNQCNGTLCGLGGVGRPTSKNLRQEDAEVQAQPGDGGRVSDWRRQRLRAYGVRRQERQMRHFAHRKAQEEKCVV